MRPGVRLGVDPGLVRVGVAASDPDGLLASPVVTLRRGQGDVADLARLVAERSAVEVLVGLPRSLSGGEGPAAAGARAYATALAGVIRPVPVRLVDERLSTVTAERTLRTAGGRVGGGGRTAGRARRKVIDQAAAVLILQAALDTERSLGAPPGEAVP